MKEDKNKTKEQNEEIKQNVHDGHRTRMRERFSRVGFDGMQDHEVLEMLLYYSVPRKDTNPLAHRLIDCFGSIPGVLDATEDQLLKVDGMTKTSASLIKMMVPLFNRYKRESFEGKRLKSSEESGKFLCNYYAGIPNERVMAVCMDASCKILAFEQISDGDAGSCLMNCRRIVELVLKYPKTTAIIISHNHPGGLALPSREDIDTTNEMIKTMRGMNISVVDHIIVAGDDFVSMASSANFRGLFG